MCGVWKSNNKRILVFFVSAACSLASTTRTIFCRKNAQKDLRNLKYPLGPTNANM